MSSYIKVKTTENTEVYLRKDQIAAVENIPASLRTEGYLKLYVAGYSFGVKMDEQSFFELLGEELPKSPSNH